ncbi:DUF3015 family protein [Pseudobacteriovorax antillogorgiicola]|uniref:DUF3015 domain-containing protein n=1 Tax=Pseudobacteriovorax antillogorgiicola TaxID=1513793 RepID=A0A1Y6BLC7_9BACT|nr:DUF3015 family protein [Pseudobacteriovorax antillogorgiicola]TCS56206.1 DUF3015 family protein [Pseudobacteriovorax antillogorgiicola]SMF08576.1 Protein of unknown function [Pseudobacteriovorax antillogorgiicola]
MKLAFVAMALALLTSPVQGADSSSGCGPGWYILKKNSLLSSAARWVTNGVLLPISTLGMTLGTSNCAKHSIVKAEKESIMYAEHNLYQLKQDIARGQGEYLNSYLGTFGCNFLSSPRIKAHLRAHFTTLFNGQDTPMAVVGSTERLLNQLPIAVETCQA